MRKWFGLHIGDWSQTYARTRVFVDKQGRQPCPAQLVKAGRIKPFGPFVTRPDSTPYVPLFRTASLPFNAPAESVI